MAINIKEILHPSDSESIKFEKINYNFDQIVANGGGPMGPKGDKGDQGEHVKPVLKVTRVTRVTKEIRVKLVLQIHHGKLSYMIMVMRLS